MPRTSSHIFIYPSQTYITYIMRYPLTNKHPISFVLPKYSTIHCAHFLAEPIINLQRSLKLTLPSCQACPMLIYYPDCEELFQSPVWMRIVSERVAVSFERQSVQKALNPRDNLQLIFFGGGRRYRPLLYSGKKYQLSYVTHNNNNECNNNSFYICTSYNNRRGIARKWTVNMGAISHTHKFAAACGLSEVFITKFKIAFTMLKIAVAKKKNIEMVGIWGQDAVSNRTRS